MRATVANSRGTKLSAVIVGAVCVLASVTLLPAQIADLSADRVLGQATFSATAPNSVDARSLFYGGVVAIDRSSSPNRLYVADANNNRVLGWKDVTSLSNGAPADIVIGQPDFHTVVGSCTRASQPAPGPANLCQPEGLAVDSAGNLYVSDTGNNRVLEYTAPFEAAQSAGLAAARVFGQFGSFTSNGCHAYQTTPSADTLCYPVGLAVDAHDNLYVADSEDTRILEYNQPLAAGGGTPGTPGSAGDTTADLVFGPSDFASILTGCGNINSNPLCDVRGLAVDSAGNLFAGVEGRVLEYDNPLAPGGGTPGTPGSAGDTTADLIIPDMFNYTFSVALDPAWQPLRPWWIRWCERVGMGQSARFGRRDARHGGLRRRHNRGSVFRFVLPQLSGRHRADAGDLDRCRLGRQRVHL